MARKQVARNIPDQQSALIVDNNTLEVCLRPVGTVAESDVLIRVATVGICRTDLYVMNGNIPTQQPIVPGHEFSGTIEAIGDGVKNLFPGDRVVVNPVLACSRCEFCGAGISEDCQSTSFLGVDCDGACCTLATVPATAVFRIPDNLSFRAATFAEPIAASLAVLKADISSHETGLIAGDNRIARLTERVLAINGFRRITVRDATNLKSLPNNEFDFAIETHATTDVLNELIRVIRPRGRIILKSRQIHPVSLTLKDLLPKEPVFHAVNYGSFEDAVALLSSGRINVSDLIGESFPLEDYAKAIKMAKQDEVRKTFISPAEAS